MTTTAHDLADIEAALDEYHDMDWINIEARFGETFGMLPKSKTPFEGHTLHKKIRHQNFARATANSLEGDLPKDGKVRTADLEITESHFASVEFASSQNLVAAKMAGDPVHSAMNIAKTIFWEAQQSLDEKCNVMLHSGKSITIALVAAKYDEDGTTYTSGQTDAFLQIKNGPISSFHRGQILDVGGNVQVEVNDVCHDTEWYGNADVGPGLVVTIASENVGDSDLDNVEADDILKQYGETGTPGFITSFDSFFNRSAPGTYFSQDRTAEGYSYLTPYGRSFAVGGTNVDIDPELHFGHWADVLGKMLGNERMYRKAHQLEYSDGLIAVANQDIINDIARVVGHTSSMFTVDLATSLSKAERQKLIGVAGFDGSIIRHPNVRPLALKADAQAKPNTITILDPHSWEIIPYGTGKIEWVMNGSSRLHPKYSSSGGLTKAVQYGGYRQLVPFCQVPQIQYRIEGVKSRLMSA